MRVEVKVQTCNNCPFFAVEGMEHMMMCTHPYWRDKAAYSGAIITQDNKYKIPAKCPLKHSPVETAVSLR